MYVQLMDCANRFLRTTMTGDGLGFGTGGVTTGFGAGTGETGAGGTVTTAGVSAMGLPESPLRYAARPK
jgi:hypothetical protein